MTASTPDDATASRPAGLSYKFERLREKLRHAIVSGEISGKLPGERLLARRYHVNAKTLSKALTDLAAEGLLDRSIGRGTYVKGQVPSRVERRWLVVCDQDRSDGEFVSLLREARPDLEILTDVACVRPSFLGNFNAVIDFGRNTPPEFLRQLAVRNFPVVSIGKLPQTFSTHAVIFDGSLAASLAARDLILAGHCRIAAIETSPEGELAKTLNCVRKRYDPNVEIFEGTPANVPALIDQGVTALVCGSCSIAEEVGKQLAKLGLSTPGEISLMAMGTSSESQPCSGYYANRQVKVDSVVHLLAETQSSRPTTLWLAGRYVDRGTTGHAPMRGSDRYVPCSEQSIA